MRSTLYCLKRVFVLLFWACRYFFTPTVLKGTSLFGWYLSYLNPIAWRSTSRTAAQLIRIGLTQLGPIFVKFGQVLSTRKDLFSDALIQELNTLQDKVPPFPSTIAVKQIESAFGRKLEDIFLHFEHTPLASASIAQVHAAILKDNTEVVVKIRRPHLAKIIQCDTCLLKIVAFLIEKCLPRTKRLQPRALAKEFSRILHEEIDFTYEAANAAQLRRNFQNSNSLKVPKIYWKYVHSTVLVMERFRGIPIGNIALLKKKGTDLRILAERGVQIFFTQVFRDCFFHADMHPGNLFVDTTLPHAPCYLGVDFGIMGSLSTQDQHYLSENMLAFFERNYRRIAQLHIESGWVSSDTPEEQFESAIRRVSEPIFERPLKDISFGQLLLNLFQTAEKYDMKVQPQLLLLQKTLFNVEGLGRQLYPDLNLWETAKPFMQEWMRKQKGLVGSYQKLKQTLPENIDALLHLPPLLHDYLKQHTPKKTSETTPPFSLKMPIFCLILGFCAGIFTKLL